MIESVRELGVLEPIVVRSVGGRFELISGHRRFQSLRATGQKETLCRVVELDDATAAVALFKANDDVEAWNDFEKGRFFQSFLRKCSLTETEAARILGISQSAVSLCLSVFEAGSRAASRANGSGVSLLERTVNRNKILELKKLPEVIRDDATHQVVENRLTERETRAVVAKVLEGASPELAATEAVNRREAAKSERYTVKKRGLTLIKCRTCGMILYLTHKNGRHLLQTAARSDG
jgi:ParB family chromosome partitioning protein